MLKEKRIVYLNHQSSRWPGRRNSHESSFPPILAVFGTCSLHCFKMQCYWQYSVCQLLYKDKFRICVEIHLALYINQKVKLNKVLNRFSLPHDKLERQLLFFRCLISYYFYVIKTFQYIVHTNSNNRTWTWRKYDGKELTKSGRLKHMKTLLIVPATFSQERYKSWKSIHCSCTIQTKHKFGRSIWNINIASNRRGSAVILVLGSNQYGSFLAFGILTSQLYIID